MRIYSTNTLRAGALGLPSIFTIGGYRVFFWSNENNEPIHVHICKGKPAANATKVWLTSKGQCILAHNNSRISSTDLNELLEIITAQFLLICDEWKKHFLVDNIRFFC